MKLLGKIKRVIRCQYGCWRAKEWKLVQENSFLQMFVFLHCRRWYTRLRYKVTFGKEMNLCCPKSFHEKLFWLSVNYCHPLIMQCADKFRVREYVRKCGCGDVLNELYGVYDKVEDIPFESLPNKFVIKSNRGSGDNFFCLDKNNLDIRETIDKLADWRNRVYGVSSAEYQYYKIPFKLICEKYLLEQPTDEMMEYQFFCFNGKPASILVRNDLETSGQHPFAVSYSLEWKREYLRKNEEQFMINVPKPKNYEKMKDYASRLASEFPHVRVDFYEVNGRLYFGELTFSTHGNVFSNYKDTALISWNNQFRLPPRYRKLDKY